MVTELPPAESPRVWPENDEPVRVFGDMLTSWNVGPSGRVIGLRYEALPIMLRINGVPRARHRETLDAIKVLEDAALRLLNKG